jgi:hypothetical protein
MARQGTVQRILSSGDVIQANLKADRSISPSEEDDGDADEGHPCVDLADADGEYKY